VLGGGMHDLKAVRPSKRGNYVKFTTELAPTPRGQGWGHATEKGQSPCRVGLTREMKGTKRASQDARRRRDRRKLAAPDPEGHLWRRRHQKPKNAKPKESNPESIHQYSMHFRLPGIASDFVDANHLGSLHLGLPRMVDPLASAEKQQPQPYQKGGDELHRNGGDGDQATGYGYNVPPMIEFECI
jgi:hypothetical protein